MCDSVFRQVRFSLYTAFIINIVFMQWLAPYKYKCDYSESKCFACGLRTAINLCLNGEFIKAIQSNKLIVIIIIIVIILIIDALYYVINKIRKSA